MLNRVISQLRASSPWRKVLKCLIDKHKSSSGTLREAPVVTSRYIKMIMAIYLLSLEQEIRLLSLRLCEWNCCACSWPWHPASSARPQGAAWNHH